MFFSGKSLLVMVIVITVTSTANYQHYNNDQDDVYVTAKMPWWSSGYDARPECERLGFDLPLRHKFFVGTHCYIWHPIMGFTDLFVWSKHEDTLSPEGGECDGKDALVV